MYGRLSGWLLVKVCCVKRGQVDGLRPGREYMLRVRAGNSRGQGPWSATVLAETEPAPPDAPGAPVIGQRAASFVRCRWEAPAEDNGATVLGYRCHTSPPLGLGRDT